MSIADILAKLQAGEPLTIEEREQLNAAVTAMGHVAMCFMEAVVQGALAMGEQLRDLVAALERGRR